MVRFSDLLGGNDEADESRPATVSAPLVTAPEPQAEADAELPTPVASPEDVLDRLTQYATSARAGDPTPDHAAAETPVAETAEPEPVAAPAADAPATEDAIPDFKVVGDDLLPRAEARKPSRSRKRRP